MLGRLRKFLGGRPRGDLERELNQIEQTALNSNPDYQAHLFNKAGDLCLEAGDEDRALRYLGRAIDAYLETGYFDVAASMCEKIIEIRPDVVRARCTLAFIALGKDLLYLPSEARLDDARKLVSEYVESAEKAGQEQIAIQRLHLMAEATDRHEVRELIGEYLLELGDTSGADKVFGAIYAERNELKKVDAHEQQERWARALQVPLKGQVEPEKGEGEREGGKQ